jgi:hypothetical protein
VKHLYSPSRTAPICINSPTTEPLALRQSALASSLCPFSLYIRSIRTQVKLCCFLARLLFVHFPDLDSSGLLGTSELGPAEHEPWSRRTGILPPSSIRPHLSHCSSVWILTYSLFLQPHLPPAPALASPAVGTPQVRPSHPVQPPPLPIRGRPPRPPVRWTASAAPSRDASTRGAVPPCPIEGSHAPSLSAPNTLTLRPGPSPLPRPSRRLRCDGRENM